jgi:CubicO group peptidase (beta-lactamase class C family)
MVFVASCAAPAAVAPAVQTTIASDTIAGTIAKYRQEIPQLMQQQDIPGLAIAVVDDQGMLWAEGFGYTDTDHRTPITPDTIFSIQSTSKTFTAAGVLMAVQDGLLDLDTPITTYLPDFTVHSIFEEHPERQITLRRLLSHTAGFTHEAPVGNNWDADAISFEDHIRSISDTWLRFPVGRGYAYSNLGIDLAGYILQKVSGQPFADYERDHLFQPLGMVNSSFDMAAIRANPNRAIGHSSPMPDVPVAVPMIPAGGMYASVDDLARFLQFQLNNGTVDGQAALDPALLDEMLTVQFPIRGQREGYGLGVARTGWYKGRNADLFSHGGGGFGFLSDLWWLPELKVGITILTNSADHDLQGNLALGILDDIVHRPGPYYDRLMALPGKTPVAEGDGGWRPPVSLAAAIRAQALPPNPAGWQGYLGEYKTAARNMIDPIGPPIRVYEEAGALYFDGSDAEDEARLRLYETATGLFFTETGQALDFRSNPPTYRNIRLVRIGSGPSTAAWIALAICGLVMFSVMLALPARLIWRRLRRRAQPPSASPGFAAAATLNSLTIISCLCGLASIGLLVVYPRLVYSGFLGWLALPAWQVLLLHAPLGLVVFAAALAALSVPAWRRRWWTRDQRWRYTALFAAILAETALLAGWRLIGLG